MKLVMIIYNASIEEEVQECMNKCELTEFTKIPSLYGKGKHSGAHMGTHIWPSTNSALLLACEDEKATKILGEVENLKGRFESLGVKAFMVNLERLI